jgi:nucleotide-binding universal stress UspA family protein
MITTTERPAAATQLLDESLRGLGPLLVATDGTESAASALHAAVLLSQQTGADVVVVAVLENLPIIAADYGILIPPIDSDQARRDSLLQRVRAQVSSLGAPAMNWTVEVRDGDPSATLAHAARQLDARLIVMGLGHHDLLDRLFGSETALHTLRATRTPVLAVPAGFHALPRRAIVATDFSVASVTAARKGLSLIDTVKLVYLLHVAPRIELQPEAFAAWMAVFGEGVSPAFERVKADLGLPESMTIEAVTRSGKPSKEILEFAREVQADLIITGSRGAGLIDRMLVGSTATGLIRGARCAVLAIPSATGESRLAWPATGNRISVDRANWAAELDAFTKRNIGRLAALEVDDPELGAQAQEHDYPFLGATWDHHDERVEVMLGDFEGVGRHLTRGIAGVTGLNVLRDEAGRDWVLRIEHAPGQTILAFRR